MSAVTFDFGQTLAELDYDFLQRRMAERGAHFDPARGRAAAVNAWHIYGAKKDEGHALAWRAMIEHILAGGGIEPSRSSELGAWLWDEQPRQNLWRKPIPGMIELVRELRRRGVPVGVISNSEGHLAELVEELGWSADFDVVVDSGRIGIDKPDPRIFQLAAHELSCTVEQLVHVGDSWEADVLGALAVGARAVLFDARHHERDLPVGAHGAHGAAELREVLARLGFVS